MPEVPSPSAAAASPAPTSPAADQSADKGKGGKGSKAAAPAKVVEVESGAPAQLKSSRWVVLETGKANVPNTIGGGVLTQFYKNQILVGQHYGQTTINAIMAAGIQLQALPDLLEEVDNGANELLFHHQK